MIAAVVVAHRAGWHRTDHALGIVLNAALTLATIASLALLIEALPTHKESATELLLSAASLWVTNILVFALWYWRLDAGGPHNRDRRAAHTNGAFLFPQMTMPPRCTRHRGAASMDADICRLSVSRLQYQHGVLANRHAGPHTMGQDPDDVSGEHLVNRARVARGSRRQHSVTVLPARALTLAT